MLQGNHYFVYTFFQLKIKMYVNISFNVFDTNLKILYKEHFLHIYIIFLFIKSMCLICVL